MKKINVLSLFDGMSCGQLAISQLGFEYNYFASEIDKHAMQVTQSNFPNTVQLGSVEHWQLWDIDFASIDLLIGGSPCQGFSFAGKQLNFEDPRSKLFFVYVDILNYIRSINPNVKFLLENVKMKKEYEAVISEHLGVQPIEINSNLVSAQNRKRLYWTNVEGVMQPEDRGIYLKDILQEAVDDKYYLSNKGLSGMLAHKERNTGKGNGFGVQFISDESEKVNTVLQRYYKDCKDSALCVVGKFRENYLQITGGFDSCNRFCYADGKHNTLIASGRDKTGVLLTDKRIRRLTPIECERLLTVPEATKKGYAEILPGECFDHEQPNSKTRRGRRMSDKANSLMAQNMSFLRFTKNYKIRRLTPIECERLQTVPDNYTSAVSDTQRYRMLGNGWTVEVIKHILKNLKA